MFIGGFDGLANRHEINKKLIDDAIDRGDFEGIEIRGVKFEKDGKTYDGARLFPKAGKIEELE